MEIVDFVPVCGSLKRYGRRRTYQRLKNENDDTEVSGDFTDKSVVTATVKMVRVIPTKVQQPKSMNLLKRFRDAYVEGMLCFALHVAHLMNNGDIRFMKKNIHHDDDYDVVHFLTDK